MTAVPCLRQERGRSFDAFHTLRRFELFIWLDATMLLKDSSDQILANAYVMPSHHLSIILALTGHRHYPVTSRMGSCHMPKKKRGQFLVRVWPYYS